jgi:negative modulator of initiation of replication
MEAAMRTINIDEDIYEFLVKNTKEIGEDASTILRRVLGLAKSGDSGKPVVRTQHELSDAFEGSLFPRYTTAVNRFLYILGVLNDQKPDEFEKVMSIQGRYRKYFAKSRQDIEKSGNSTQPKQIPGSEYWVMTNSPTSQKKVILKEVLECLNYSDDAIRAAVSIVE